MRAAAELPHQLNTCTEYSQLEAIVFDRRLRWTPANVKVAFEALVRISLGRQLPIFHDKGSMSDGAYDVLSQSQTPLLLLAKFCWQTRWKFYLPSRCPMLLPYCKPWAFWV
ncbi:MAG: hypothetical protein ACPIOQ_29665 [Promethearchaeia archaeon]